MTPTIDSPAPKRHSKLILAIVIAVPVAVAGFGIKGELDSRRADREFNQHQVGEYSKVLSGG